MSAAHSAIVLFLYLRRVTRIKRMVASGRVCHAGRWVSCHMNILLAIRVFLFVLSRGRTGEDGKAIGCVPVSPSFLEEAPVRFLRSISLSQSQSFSSAFFLNSIPSPFYLHPHPSYSRPPSSSSSPRSNPAEVPFRLSIRTTLTTALSVIPLHFHPLLHTPPATHAQPEIRCASDTRSTIEPSK